MVKGGNHKVQVSRQWVFQENDPCVILAFLSKAQGQAKLRHAPLLDDGSGMLELSSFATPCQAAGLESKFMGTICDIILNFRRASLPSGRVYE